MADVASLKETHISVFNMIYHYEMNVGRVAQMV